MTNYAKAPFLRGGDDTVAAGDMVKFMGKVEIDMADVAADTDFTTADSYTVLYIPTDSFFTLHQVECVTTLSGITRIDIGDEDDDDEFVSNATTLTAGTNLTITKATHSDGAYVSGTAGQVRVKITGTPSTGRLRLVYEYAGGQDVPIARYRTYTN